ncbi:hydroperoxide isomerase ALOXE3-like [Salvelinus namaycush]|uniref:Hydroperoxide isomerase ALOXE3-like n=1 Tax=Salvelinus namaycush TaxID=8040 RepID=A0A8U0QDQ8_SALNM|nr:hydroperoxide isomerase ALOXE3-like [Salvelinus namaycush]XP_038841306.1 hydroperoxide isomerase ALOXE3-like [Salvelinus namaycush]
MARYKVTVHTHNITTATTMNNVFIKLVGEKGESKRTWLTSLKGLFYQGTASREFDVVCPSSLSTLVLIELDKQPLPLFPQDAWFPSKVIVTTPEGDTCQFPIYRWIMDKEVHLFREGTAKRLCDETNHLARYSREKEMKKRTEQYCWDTYKEGFPGSMKADNPLDLPSEIQFSFTKATQFLFTAATGITELKLKGYSDNKKSWKNIDEISKVFCCNRTVISDYTQEHWKEDEFFGYQYLNGCNPMLIRRCSDLPANFPVTEDMVKPSLRGSSSLLRELQSGNIFLLDYKNLDGLKANVINRKKQYMAAPLVLLYRTPNDKLVPIAIQLKQKPAKDNPIFLPTDSEYDWLLAKIFVRSADFQEHQLNVHLLRTHLLAEVFAVALLRNMPMVHPLYKLLIPHTRYSLQINLLARALLIADEGVFTQFAASGGEGMIEILRRSVASLTYSSLCVPEDITARGLESVPNNYYRDDGLKLWDIIHRFVEEVISFYYKSDSEVRVDQELQNWIKDIFDHGFLAQECTGIPQSFSTVPEVVKFVTVVIFTCSGQHSAVNSGQYDYGGWMPNTPISLKQPPPTTKGQSTESTMLETLPDVGTTAQGMSTMWLLSKQSSDFVALGQYPEEHFNEIPPCRMIQKFQTELKVFSETVNARNSGLPVPYTYMDPAVVENSVAI